MCSPVQHWAGWTLRPEQTNTADALYDGIADQRLLCCCLDPWALSRGKRRGKGWSGISLQINDFFLWHY